MNYQNTKHWNLLKNDLVYSKNIVIIFILFFSISHSQTNRFYYTVSFKIDTIDTYKHDLMVLDINKDKNLFYSNEYNRADSISTSTQSNIFPQPTFEDIVIYYNEKQDYQFIKILSMNYYKYSAKKSIDWSIEKEKKKIGNFSVQKATASFVGRKWVAWFSEEIPLPYGPYFFSGLPGLVLEVYDVDYNFHFSFIRNRFYKEKTNSEELINKATENFLISIKEEEWKKVQINYYQNPISEYKNGDAYMTKDNGENFTVNDYKNLEKQIQTQIKMYNNPIELSSKINYDNNFR